MRGSTRLSETIKQITDKLPDYNTNNLLKRSPDDAFPESLNDIEVNEKTPVPVKHIKQSDAPVLNALLTSLIFRVKQSPPNIPRGSEDTFKPLQAHKQDQFFSVVNPQNGDYIHTLVNLFSIGHLNQNSVHMLYVLLNIFQKYQTNKLEITYTDIFDILGYQKTSRTPNMKTQTKKYILSLGNIFMETRIRQYHTELSKQTILDEDIYDYQTSYWHPIFVEYYRGTFNIALNDLLYDVYDNSKWNAVDLNEFSRLKLDSAKSLYRYITFRDIGTHKRISISASELCRIAALDDYTKKEANRTLKRGLCQLYNIGVIDYFNIDKGRNVWITIVPKKMRTGPRNKTANDWLGDINEDSSGSSSQHSDIDAEQKDWSHDPERSGAEVAESIYSAESSEFDDDIDFSDLEGI